MKKDNLIILVAFILCCGFLFVYFGTRHNKEYKLDSCLEIQGTTLKNNCDKYSFTFPFNNESIFEDEGFICQEEQKKGGEGNKICFADVEFDEEHPFNFEYFTKETEKRSQILYKKSQVYNGNPAYCFIVKGTSFPTLFCYMQIKDTPKYGFYIATLPQESEIPLEKLEKLMNSYKSW